MDSISRGCYNKGLSDGAAYPPKTYEMTRVETALIPAVSSVISFTSLISSVFFLTTVCNNYQCIDLYYLLTYLTNTSQRSMLDDCGFTIYEFTI